ncbi:MAG: MerR family transcriptional regulator [Methylotenera sp.]|nr:MerR family transcriptional regulator [Methylotenera sp.]MDP3819805.1 MerR family transcriptional regulator [Methylotenera sp.]
MSDPIIKVQLPPIPAKRYFTIGEVSELCGVKPHVLRYWEQEFTQLKPVKRRGNRRYYQHHEVLLIRRIRELLYEQGFTISGARNRLDGPDEVEIKADVVQLAKQLNTGLDESVSSKANGFDFSSVKDELLEILNLLRSLPQASK